MIVACAIKHRRLIYTLPRPARHHAILHKMPYPRDMDHDIAGFITSTGEFVDRKEAWCIATEHNQIIRRCGGDGDWLFSENLW